MSELLNFNLKPFFDRVDKTPLLSKEEEKELSKKVQDGDLKAKARFILANMRLVISIAKKFTSSGIPLTDLCMEGVFGLIRAVEKFNPDRGAKFSTYATNWIKTFIAKAIQRQTGPIYVPIHAQQKVNLYYKLCNTTKEEDLEEVLMRELGAEQVEKAEEIYRISQDTFSLSETICENEFTFEDVLVEDGEYEEMEDRALLIQDVRDSLTFLNDGGEDIEAQLVISHRYGIEGKEILSYEELADLLNEKGFFSTIISEKKFICDTCGITKRLQEIPQDEIVICDKCNNFCKRSSRPAPHNKTSVKEIERDALLRLQEYFVENGYSHYE